MTFWRRLGLYAALLAGYAALLPVALLLGLAYLFWRIAGRRFPN